MQVLDNRTFIMKNPDWLSSQLLAARLRMGLPVVTGKVTVESLKNEEIRRSVAAYYHMIMRFEMPGEPVHFGVGECDDPRFLHLLATQKIETFPCVYKYSMSFGRLVVDGYHIFEYADIHKIAPPVLDIITVQEEVILSVEKVDVRGFTTDLIVPEFHQPLVCDKIDCVLDYSYEGQVNKEKNFFVSGEGEKGDYVTILLPSCQNLWDVEVEPHIGLDIKCEVNLVNLNELYVTKIGYDKHSLGCYRVKRKGKWTVCLTVSMSYHCLGRYVYVPPTPYSDWLERRIRKYFSMLVMELNKLPRTELVLHNIFALTFYRFPMKMPDPWLLNQVLNMLNRRWEMSNWYIFSDERWSCYKQYSNWGFDIARALRLENVVYIGKMLYEHVGLASNPYFSCLQCPIEFSGYAGKYIPYDKFVMNYNGIFEKESGQNYMVRRILMDSIDSYDDREGEYDGDFSDTDSDTPCPGLMGLDEVD